LHLFWTEFFCPDRGKICVFLSRLGKNFTDQTADWSVKEWNGCSKCLFYSRRNCSRLNNIVHCVKI
jgi:hypothetical protein